MNPEDNSPELTSEYHLVYPPKEREKERKKKKERKEGKEKVSYNSGGWRERTESKELGLAKGQPVFHPRHL